MKNSVSNVRKKQSAIGLSLVLGSLGLLLSGCGNNNHSHGELTHNSGNIVGGTVAGSKDFPSVVALVRDGKVFCSGNLIAINKIVTAAHCVTTFQYQKKDDILVMAKKVTDEIKLVMPKKTLEEFKALSAADQERLFRAKTAEVLEKETSGIQIHFGLGKAELGATIAETQDLIKTVSLPADAKKFAVAKFMQQTIYKTTEDTNTKYNQKFDIAYLALKKDIKDVTPIPLISANEHAESVFLGDDVTLVGFGLKVDKRILGASLAEIEKLEKAIGKEKNKTKKLELEVSLNTEKMFLLESYLDFTSSGNKMYVTTKLDNYDQDKIVVTSKDEKLSGACQGDSGGPALVKNKAGNWRQLGVTVTVNVCGLETQISPLFDK